MGNTSRHEKAPSRVCYKLRSKGKKDNRKKTWMRKFQNFTKRICTKLKKNCESLYVTKYLDPLDHNKNRLQKKTHVEEIRNMKNHCLQKPLARKNHILESRAKLATSICRQNSQNCLKIIFYSFFEKPLH